MNALAKMTHRHAFLNSSEQSGASQQLAAAFAATVVPFQAPGMLAEGVLEGVACDLIYALLRHRLWTETPLFTAVLVDYLASTYHLERPVAQSLTASLLPLMRQHRPRQSLLTELNDAAFIRYVCVATATALDEAALELDLGIGRHLLQRIKLALSCLFSDDDPRTARYLPELDAQITAVVCGLGEELKSLPWALQLERLRYLLAQIHEPWLSVLKEHGVAWLFDLLLQIATKGMMTSRQIGALLRGRFPHAKTFVLDSSAAALCQELGRHRLLTMERGMHTWRVLPLAEELTAEAFATAYVANHDAIGDDTLKLASAFQASIVRLLELDAEALTHLILRQRPLAPAALKAALLRLREREGDEVLAACVRQLLDTEPSAWLRRGVSDLAVSLGIAQAPAGMARSGLWCSDSTHIQTASSALD